MTHQLQVGNAAPAQHDGDPPWRKWTTRTPEELGRFVNIEAAFERYGHDVMRVFLDGAMSGDDLAVEVVKDLKSTPGGDGMVDRAITEGIEAVPEAPESLSRLFEQLDAVPEWVDWEQLKRGAISYFRGGPLCSMVFTCCVVSAGNQSPSMNREVALTGRFEDMALIRANETFRWLLAACSPGGMERQADGFRYTVKVRLLHARIRSAIMKSPRWDWDNWGSPISDTNALWAVGYEFSTAHIDGLRRIGFRFSTQEEEDIFALWRYIGYVIGVPEDRLFRSPEEARLHHEIFEFTNPGPDEISARLVRALIELATPLDGSKAPKVFPELVNRVMTPLRMRNMIYGLMRFWVGDDLAEQLGAPQSRWKALGHVLRPAVMAFEITRSLLPIDDEKVSRRTRELLTAEVAPEAGEAVIANPNDVEAGFRARSSAAESTKKGQRHAVHTP